LLTGLCVLAMVVFVAIRAWPTFSHNGLAWLGPGGNVDTEIEAMLSTSVHAPAAAFHLRAWPIIYGTLLSTVLAVALALPLAVPSSVFIVELAPAALRRVSIPVVRLLASIPSVVYGLIGVLVLVPFVGNHVITASERTSVQYRVQLTGASL